MLSASLTSIEYANICSIFILFIFSAETATMGPFVLALVNGACNNLELRTQLFAHFFPI